MITGISLIYYHLSGGLDSALTNMAGRCKYQYPEFLRRYGNSQVRYVRQHPFQKCIVFQIPQKFQRMLNKVRTEPIAFHLGERSTLRPKVRWHEGEVLGNIKTKHVRFSNDNTGNEMTQKYFFSQFGVFLY